jgi:hypothetical protein
MASATIRTRRARRNAPLYIALRVAGSVRLQADQRPAEAGRYGRPKMTPGASFQSGSSARLTARI